LLTKIASHLFNQSVI